MEENKSLVIRNPEVIENKDLAFKFFELCDISKNTLADYCYYLPLFLKYIQKNGFDKTSYLGFKRWLKEQNQWTIATKQKYLVSARVWVKQLYRQGIIPVDLIEDTKTFKQSVKHKKFGLNDKEMEKLTAYLSELEDEKTRAIFGLLVFQGLRSKEVCDIDVEDLTLNDIQSSIMISSKGSDDKERVLLLNKTARLLNDYLRKQKLKSGALFVSKKGKKRLTTRGLRRVVDKVFDELEITATTHGIRHWFVSNQVKKNNNLLEIIRWTRHSSVSTLMIYYDELSLENSFDKFSQAFRGINF